MSEEKPPRATRYMVYLYEGDKHVWGMLPALWEPGMPVPNFMTDDGWESEKANGACIRSFSEENITKSAKPGQVYRFDFTPDLLSVHYFRNKHAPCEGMCGNSELTVMALALQAKYDAERANAKIVSTGTRAQALAFLEPVREAYQKLPSTSRAQMLAMIVAYVTSPYPKGKKT